MSNASNASARHELAAALREGAARLRIDRSRIAGAVGVAPRTVSRWTNGQLLPMQYTHARLVALFAPAGEDIAQRIRRALGMPAPPAPAATQPTRDPAAAKRDFDLALLAMADALDRSPRRVRESLVDFVASVSALGLSLADARALLVPPSKGRTSSEKKTRSA
jgi:hypothetical protein